ncbi:MAG: SH3 domain-containing protein, partial [Acetobacteraceae bacterium]|nr:SH3 domain-containing protein [Acetobacteraceae bacterium]
PAAQPALQLAATHAAPAEMARVALGRVTTSAHTGANVRTAPRSGEVLRTAPRNTTLEVFGEAPGGWFQVGLDGTPWGWVHASVLASNAR